MMLIAHDTLEQAQESASALAALGQHARKLLAECVEATGVKRKQLRVAAKALESAGFLFVRDTGNIWESEFQLMPTLEGEEALQVLDEVNEKKESEGMKKRTAATPLEPLNPLHYNEDRVMIGH